MRLSICCAVGDVERFERCLSASLDPQLKDDDELICIPGDTSLANTYDIMQKEATRDICVYVHEDLILQAPWLENFRATLEDLERLDPNWGLLGISGMRVNAPREMTKAAQDSVCDFLNNKGMTDPDKAYISPHHELPLVIRQFLDRQEYIFNIRECGERHGYLFSGKPGLQRVEALDSVVIAKKRIDTMTWDVNIPFFGAGVAEDICLQAWSTGRGIYCNPLYAEHETIVRSQESPSYMAGRKYIMEKWNVRPILTTAGIWF